MPMAFHQMSVSAEEKKYVKESCKELRTQQKADTKAAMEENIEASDKSSDSFPDPTNKPDQGKSGGAKRTKAKRAQEKMKEKKTDECKSDEDNEEYSNPDEYYALPKNKNPRSNMVRASRSTKKKGKRKILDSGASHNTLKDLDHVEEYVKLNKDRSITMKTAPGHKMTVTHTGYVRGIGDTMIVPETDEKKCHESNFSRTRTD
jgi:hypothetical protein